MMDIRALLEKPCLFDGSKGVFLQQLGLKGGECPDEWNISHPADVSHIYRSYLETGAGLTQFIQTNTLNSNALSLARHGLGDRMEEINRAGAELAVRVRDEFGSGVICGNVGPSGSMLAPMGTLSWQALYDAMLAQARALAAGGVDCLHLETFVDLRELKVAVLAALETGLPVLATVAFDANGNTMMNNSPECCAAVLDGLGVTALGANCSEAEGMVEVIRRMAQVTSLPLIAKPNAGMPEVCDGETIYHDTPEMFADFTERFLNAGVRLLGGCCGTLPPYITAIGQRMAQWQGSESRNPLPVAASASRWIAAGEGAVTWVEANDDDPEMVAMEWSAVVCERLGIRLPQWPLDKIEELGEQVGVYVKTPLAVAGGGPGVAAFGRRYAGVF